MGDGRMRWRGAGWVALVVSGAAAAADKPLYQPAPAWVAPAPAIDASKLGDDTPILVRLDTQERLADGIVWSYRDVATRLASPEVVTQAGTLSIPWDPAKGDLIVHSVEIIRGGQRIDALAGGKRFTVIRREEQLEQQAIDGRLTATLPVEGLRVGDVLHMAVTVSRREAALGGAMQDIATVPALPLRVGYARTRLLWPAASGVRWRYLGEGAGPKVTTVGGDAELLLVGAAPKAAELPDDAPLRFRKPPMLEASSFADWAAVSTVMAPHYGVEGSITPGGALARQVAALMAADRDPLHRVEAALELVQGQVRYLADGLDQGNYVPQSPERTWMLRYGDCKAKTLLLIALLDAMGIQAEPVLASTQESDALPERLPSAAAFDHVLVRATVDGRDYWLDGTGSGARLDSIADVPPLRWVLPVRAVGASLLAVPARPPSRPTVAIQLDYDQSAGIRLPTIVRFMATVRGPAAAMIGLANTQGSKEQKDRLVYGLVNKTVGGDAALADYALRFDAKTGIAVIEATGMVTTRWRRRDGRYRLALDKTLADLTFAPDRARAAWRAIPVATGTPDALELVTRVKLGKDAAGVVLEGSPTLDADLGPVAIRRTAALNGDTIAVREQAGGSGAEIAPAEIAAARARIDLAKRRMLEAVAPADVAQRWDLAGPGRKDGRFAPLLALYAKAIAADPQEASAYASRANLLQGIGQWRESLPDLDHMVSIDPDADNLMTRARLYRVLGDDERAGRDATAALKLDGANADAIGMLARLDARAGRHEAALARVQEQIDAGGDGKSGMIALKLDLLALAGRGAAALAAADAAIAAKPGDPGLLNARCWLKGQLNQALDTALKDCTKAIELSDSPGQALDSRALVYFRMNRLDDAIADLDAALEAEPEQAGSLYLRGIIGTRRGKGADAARDLAAARFIAPRVAEDYAPYGIAP